MRRVVDVGERARRESRAARSTGSTCRRRGRHGDRAFFEPLRALRLQSETELYLGLLRSDDPEERTLERIALAHELVGELRRRDAVRLGPAAAGEGSRAARGARAVTAGPSRRAAERTRFAWPAGFPRIPDEEWVGQPVDSFGLQYDTVENHGWYRNLDPTVEQLARASSATATS